MTTSWMKPQPRLNAPIHPAPRRNAFLRPCRSARRPKKIRRHPEESENAETEEYNGEEVRKSMEQWRVAEWIRTGTTGVAFAMAVVGIWGDGA